MHLRDGLTINDNGHLVIGGCDAVELAKEYGTPLYVYDEDYIRRQCDGFLSALSECEPAGVAAYASKAFMTTAMARLMDKCGMWLDCVSAGEMHAAQRAGFPAGHIILHGSNKTAEELNMAVGIGVGRVVIDDLWEIDALNDICAKAGIVQSVFLRVNPGVEAHTHEYIQTARVDSKFGVGYGEAIDALCRIEAADNLRLCGIHTHLGSQIFNMDAFDICASKILTLMDELRSSRGVTLPEINMGGGFSVHYTDADAPVTPADAVGRLQAALRRECGARDYPIPRMFIEPGRSIVAESCVALYSVGTVKAIPGVRHYVSIDGGLADNPRPEMYGAVYEAALANRMNDAPADHYRIAGRSCETDTLIGDVELAEPRRGDILAVFTGGAYQYAMASNYNRVPLPAVALVSGGRSALMARSQTIEELTQLDEMPDWL